MLEEYIILEIKICQPVDIFLGKRYHKNRWNATNWFKQFRPIYFRKKIYGYGSSDFW